MVTLSYTEDTLSCTEKTVLSVAAAVRFFGADLIPLQRNLS